MNVPQLRFSGFDGEWEEVILGNLGDFMKGMALSKADISEVGDPCILYGELYTKYGPVINHVHSRTNSIQNKRVLGIKNDVLIPSSGETAIDIACASTLETENVLLGGDLNIFRPKESVSGVFLSYQINGVRKFELSKLAQGASVVHLYSNSLKNFNVKLPTYEEQQKISTFLKLLDRKNEKKKQKIEKLEQFKKGVMQKIFSLELRFKDEGLKWGQLRLRDVCTISSGKRLPKGHSFSQEGVPYISVSDMGEKYVNKASFSFIAQDTEKILNKYKVKTGDVIISIAGTLGKINLIDDSLNNSNLTENCNKITNFKNVINTYIYYCLKSEAIQRKIKEISTTSSQPKLALDRLRDFYIFVPSIDEQQKISEFLIALDKKVEKEKEKLIVLEEQKKGFMQGMFV